MTEVKRLSTDPPIMRSCHRNYKYSHESS